MDQRISMVTLGVSDPGRARAFYGEVLGWTPAPQSVGDVVFFQAGGVALALYPRALLAEDARVADGGRGSGDGAGFAGITLAHNVRAREEVDRVLAEVAARGGRILKPAEDAFWGGRSGYFADPDGYAWEVAWNPGFPLDREGIVRLVPPTRRKRRAARPGGAARRSRVKPSPVERSRAKPRRAGARRRGRPA